MKPRALNITAEQVRQSLSYSPETGEFSRNGEIAGFIHRTGTRVIKVKSQRIQASQLAWIYVHGEWSDTPLLHKNGNRLDDRIENLTKRVRAPIVKKERRPLVRPSFNIDRARELLNYDPVTGHFTWRIDKYRANAGSRAGRNCHGYVVITIDGKTYPAHRLAWLLTHGEMPQLEIDHRDGNRSNNAISNLRLATRKQNCANTPACKSNKSGIKGVYFEKRRRKWRAVIKLDGKQVHLGLHKNIEDAAAAYRQAEIAGRGEFSFALSRNTGEIR